MLKKGMSYATVQMVAVLYLVVWSVSPFMEIDNIYRLLAVAFFGVWCLFLVLRQKPLVIEPNTMLAMAFLVAVALVAYIDTGKGSGIIKQNKWKKGAQCQ